MILPSVSFKPFYKEMERMHLVFKYFSAFYPETQDPWVICAVTSHTWYSWCISLIANSSVPQIYSICKIVINFPILFSDGHTLKRHSLTTTLYAGMCTHFTSPGDSHHRIYQAGADQRANRTAREGGAEIWLLTNAQAEGLDTWEKYWRFSVVHHISIQKIAMFFCGRVVRGFLVQEATPSAICS